MASAIYASRFFQFLATPLALFTSGVTVQLGNFILHSGNCVLEKNTSTERNT